MDAAELQRHQQIQLDNIAQEMRRLESEQRLLQSQIDLSSFVAGAGTVPATGTQTSMYAGNSHRRYNSVLSNSLQGGIPGQFGGQSAVQNTAQNAPPSQAFSHARHHSAGGNGLNSSAFRFPQSQSQSQYTQQSVAYAQQAPAASSFSPQYPPLFPQYGTGNTFSQTSTPQPQHTVVHTVPQASPTRGYGHHRGSSSFSYNQSMSGQLPLGPITLSPETALACLRELNEFRNNMGFGRPPRFVPNVTLCMSSYGGGPPNSGNSGGGHGGNRKSLFGPYLPTAAVEPLLAGGHVARGVLHINKRNRSDSFVMCENLGKIYISGSRDRNRGLDGDTVLVQLLDMDQVLGAKRDKERKKPLGADGSKLADNVEVEGQSLTLFSDTAPEDAAYAGHVVAVLDRMGGQHFCGTISTKRPQQARRDEQAGGNANGHSRNNSAVSHSRNNSTVSNYTFSHSRSNSAVSTHDAPAPAPARIVWFRPFNKRVPLIAIPSDQVPESFFENEEAFTNVTQVCFIRRWPVSSLHPFGQLLRQPLGTIGDPAVELSALVRESSFFCEDFGDALLAPALPPAEDSARPTFDATLVAPHVAYTVQKLPNGSTQVILHFPDASHFVRPNSPLDREARKRLLALRMPQRSIDMVPARVAQQCAFAAGESRLAVSVALTFNADGAVTAHEGLKTVVSFSTSGVDSESSGKDGKDGEDAKSSDKATQDKGDAPTSESTLETLRFLASRLRARRLPFTGTAADPPPSEVLQYRVDPASGFPLDVSPAPSAENITDEFVIEAGKYVGGLITSNFTDRALLFTQATPDSPEIVLPGSRDISDFFHATHNVPIFSSFRDSLTNYAHLLVLRQFESCLADATEATFTLDTETVSRVTANVNNKAHAAAEAQEQILHLNAALLIGALTQRYGAVVRRGIVRKVRPDALDVFIPEFGLEKRIHLGHVHGVKAISQLNASTLKVSWTNRSVLRWVASGAEGILGVPPPPPAFVNALPAEAPEDSAQHALSRAHQRLGPSDATVRAALNIDTATNAQTLTETISASNEIAVVVSVDLNKSPPVIKVLTLNPFAN